ncbi:unnamed protein product [Heligmosomoides polygyrus]|uniref:GATA zinc finger domain-containing protein 14-like n=1 Tax=Heligmosomoides polygyrus TaxID=6339 RepID=A0A183F6V7_HELPZ|nr:unnamed protein product [Heligmosomoides polygyrus]
MNLPGLLLLLSVCSDRVQGYGGGSRGSYYSGARAPSYAAPAPPGGPPVVIGDVFPVEPYYPVQIPHAPRGDTALNFFVNNIDDAHNSDASYSYNNDIDYTHHDDVNDSYNHDIHHTYNDDIHHTYYDDVNDSYNDDIHHTYYDDIHHTYNNNIHHTYNNNIHHT